MKITSLLKPTPFSTPASVALFLVRLVAGLAFLHHGFGKIQHPFDWMGPSAPVPGFFQLLAAISEFGGGLAWVLGLLTPLASFGILCTMTVATGMMAGAMHAPFVSATGGPSFELPLLYWTIALFLMLGGPGRISLDRLIFGSKS